MNFPREAMMYRRDGVARAVVVSADNRRKLF